MKAVSGLVCISVMLLAGCATRRMQDELLVTRPNMQFSRTVIYSYTSKIMPQIQPGLAVSGGAQASSCTMCR
jgi:hypothetical protein